MADTLEVKIDTSAAKASLDSLKEAVSKLSTSLTNIDKKNDAFDRLVSALSNLNTSGISGLASSFGQLSQTASQAATAAQQVAGAARQASSSSQAAAGAATQWAAGLRQAAQAAAQNISGLGSFNAGLTGVAAALARTGGGLSAATGQFGQFGVAIQNSVSNFNMLSGIGFPPGISAGIAAATAAIIAMAAALPALLSAIVETNNQIIAFKNTMDAIRGNGAGETAFRELAKTAQETSTDIGTLTKNFAGFDAAAKSLGVSTAQSQQLFKELAGAMRVMGVAGVKAERVMGAFQQMASKGKIQMEELKQQMGEAMPTAIQAMSNALGVSIGAMTKMLEQGQVSATILPRFTQELLKLSGGWEAVGRASVTVSAQMTQLNNNFTLLAESFGKGISLGFMSQLASGLQAVNAALDNAGFHIFAAAIGDLAGLLGGIFLQALGAVLQVLSVIAGAVGGVISVFTGFINVIKTVAQAFMEWSFVKGLVEGFSAFFTGLVQAFEPLQAAISAVTQAFTGFVSAVTDTTGAFGKWVQSLFEATGLSKEIGQAIGFMGAAFLTVVAATTAAGAAIALVGTAIGAVATAAAAARGVLTALNAAILLAAVQAKAAAAGTLIYRNAVIALNIAMTALARNPLVAALLAASVVAGTMSGAFEAAATAVGNLASQVPAFIASLTPATQQASMFEQAIRSATPTLAELQAKLQSSNQTVSEIQGLYSRAASGMTAFEASAEGVARASRDAKEAIASNNSALDGIRESYDRSKNAGKNFEIGIQSQIEHLQRQKKDLTEVGIAGDLYDTKIQRLQRTLKNSQLAEQDAANAMQRHQQEIQRTNNAIQEAIAKRERAAEVAKLYGAALEGEYLQLAKTREEHGYTAQQAGTVAAAYQVLQTSVAAATAAFQAEATQRAQNATLAAQDIKFLTDELELLQKKEAEGKKLTAAELDRKNAAQQGLAVAKEVYKNESIAQLLAEARVRSIEKEIGIQEALAQVAEEKRAQLDAEFGSTTKAIAAANDMNATATKTAEGQKKLSTETGNAATSAQKAATELDKIKGVMDGIATGGDKAAAGVTKFGEGAKTANTAAAPVAETFTKISGAMSVIAEGTERFATAMTTLAPQMTAMSSALATLKFDTLVAGFTALAPLMPIIATNFGAFASSNTLLAQSMPLVNEQMTKLGEILPSITSQTTLLGEASTQIGTGFQQWGAALPIITEGLAGMQETLPPFVSSMTTLASALEKIKGSTDALKLMVTAIDEVLPKLDEMKTAITGVKTAVDQANKAFGEDFVKAFEEAGPKAAAAVAAMAGKIESDMARVVAAIQQAIDKLKELAAAQASSGGGGGGDTTAPAQRYGGMAGVSSQVQSVSPGAFANAPQFASGTDNTNKFMRKLPGGGIPSILHPNEAVVPLPKGGSIPVQFTTPLADQTNMLSSALDALASDLKPLTTNAPPPTLYATDKIEAAVKAAANAASTSKGRANDAGGGEPPMNINFNITTPDADSFKRSETQIKADAYRVMREAYNRNR